MKLQSVLSCLLMIFSLPSLWGQAIEILLESGDYPAIVQHYEERGDELTNEELYMVGLSYFQLENDQKAIELYDKAIANGLDEDYVYLYKGLALRYDEQHEASIASLRKAVAKKPDSQINYTELGNGFFYAEQYDSALVYLSQARGMAFELGDPYLRVPLIYEIQEQYEKALEEYKISAELMDKTDPAYIEILASMGMLHHTAFKDYPAAIEAYNQALQVAPDLYNLYPLLIQAYNANGAYAKGDSLFEPLRVAYQEGGLAEDYQEMGSAGIEEFVWKGKSVVVHKYFEQPKETLDYIYIAYILKENTDSIDFMIMTEKTLQFMEDSPKHLLCGKQPGGSHFTYSYGWSEDEIPYASFREALLLVMDDKINPAASSNFSAAPAEEDASNKKKRKGKKKKNQGVNFRCSKCIKPMFFNLLFRPTRAFQRIENGMNEALVREGMILYLALGILRFILTERQAYFGQSILHAVGGLFYYVGLEGMWGLGIALALYLIGRYLGGAAYFSEIFVLLAYLSGMALLGEILLSSLLTMVHNFADAGFWWIYYGVAGFLIFLYLKILFQGLKYLNEFGFKKALLTLLPLMILMAGLTFGVLNFLQK